MDTRVDVTSINRLFSNAEADGRSFLFEYEVYDLIRIAGSETPPRYIVLAKNEKLDKSRLDGFPGEYVVIKVVSPYILHKSDVGGVRIVKKRVEDVLSTVRRMYYEVPEAFSLQIQQGRFTAPPNFAHLAANEFETLIKESIAGVVLCQYMLPDSQEFGNELLVSLRRTREFGMILSAGLGGTDTELYAKRFRKGQAIVAASTEMVSGEEFFNLFKKTISYKKLAGLTRGQKRIVTNEQLLECFSAMIQTGNHFSSFNKETPYVIDELEINPFAFSNYLMLPLDGLCRFSKKGRRIGSRPVKMIDKMLHPANIGVVGASAKGTNIGRIIVENILKMGFPRENLFLVHPDARTIESIKALPDLKSIPQKLDLLILAVNAESIPSLVDDVIQLQIAESVILIPGGIGEAEEQQYDMERILETLEAARENDRPAPIFLGGNSLGVLSHPGGYDGVFIPEEKLPKSKGDYRRKTAIVSQSGAYMITRMSKLSFLDPAYAVSIGNQLDLTAGDFLQFFKDSGDLETIAFYIEGFADLDGLSFARAVRHAVERGKEIVFYKAGRTEEGKTAMSGHTASIAGDYMVCESCVSQAGAFVAETFSEFEGLLRLSRSLYTKKITGSRLAAISNAGYESVGIADNILGEDYSLGMAEFCPETEIKLKKIISDARLQSLVHVANPMDVTPMATEGVYEAVMETLLSDDNIDLVIVAIVPLTPLLHTLPDEYVSGDVSAATHDIVGKVDQLNKQSDKPLVMVVDSGPLYDHLSNALEEQGLAVFRSADQAVRVLGKYVQTRLNIAANTRGSDVAAKGK